MSKNNLKPASAVINDLRMQGFTTDFRFANNRLIPLQYPSRQYTADDVEVLDTYRFEGDTDPADASILYVIRTNDGLQGTLSNAYGPMGDSGIDDFFNKTNEHSY